MQIRLNTPHEMPNHQTLEQRADYIKSREEYSTGLIIIFEVVAGETTVHSNFGWIQEADGSLTPDYNSPNQNFVDEH